MPAEELSDNQILIVAPKKKFHHAVDRNRVKRQLRDIFRRNKHSLYEALDNSNRRIVLGLVFSDDKLWDSQALEERMLKTLSKLEEAVRNQ